MYEAHAHAYTRPIGGRQTRNSGAAPLKQQKKKLPDVIG